MNSIIKKNYVGKFNIGLEKGLTLNIDETNNSILACILFSWAGLFKGGLR